MTFVALSPFYILAATIVILMLVAAFFKNHKVAAIVSTVGLLLAIATLFKHCSCLPLWARPLIEVDGTSWMFVGITLISALLINILSFFYFEKSEEKKEEYYVLFNTAVLGTLVMIVAKHFVTFFLGLELLSIPLYVLVAYNRTKASSIEAAIKYLALAGASSAALLFGLALIYGASGSMDIYSVGEYFKNTTVIPAFGLVGIALFIAAIGFKLALAPFHMWSPDVYDGAPAPVTAFLASVSKAGVLAFVINFFAQTGINSFSPAYYTLVVLAIASMFAGNLLALRQTNVKRILAYSSIAHMGYLMVAIIAGGSNGVSAVVFYLASYFITSVAAFGVIGALSGNEEPKQIEDYRGLYFRYPLLAMTLAVSLLSLIGMPLTAGFIGKFFVAMTGAASNNWMLVGILIINSIISIYYYLKIITVLFRKSEVDNAIAKIPVLVSIVLAISILAIIWLGVAPGGFLRLMQ